MKKYLIYGGLIIALIGGIFYFYYTFSPTTLNAQESNFAIQDLDAIYEIKISNEKGESILLEKKPTGWLINQIYASNDESMGMLLDVIRNMRMKSPVPAAAHNNVIRSMMVKHFKCEIWDKNKNILRTFYVGDSPLDGVGNYMLLEVDGKMAEKPYIVEIPKLKGGFQGRFKVEEERWRNFWICRVDPEQIKNVKIVYHENPANSFEINRITKDSVTFANGNGEIKEQPKQKYMYQYFGFLSSLSLEAYENKNPYKDSLLNTTPFITFSVTDTADKKSETWIYRMPLNEKSVKQFDESGAKLKYDMDHYLAFINDKKDFVLIQNPVWGNALRHYDEFLRKPTTKK